LNIFTEKNRMANLKQELEIDVHKVHLDELCKRFFSDQDKGLTTAQVKINAEHYGANALTPPPTTPEWVKFCKNLFSGFAMLLWIGAILCFVAYSIQVNIFTRELVELKGYTFYFVVLVVVRIDVSQIRAF
jgi:sodium/potassium-transporting ATPase subunit alpha